MWKLLFHGDEEFWLTLNPSVLNDVWKGLLSRTVAHNSSNRDTRISAWASSILVLQEQKATDNIATLVSDSCVSAKPWAEVVIDQIDEQCQNLCCIVLKNSDSHWILPKCCPLLLSSCVGERAGLRVVTMVTSHCTKETKTSAEFTHHTKMTADGESKWLQTGPRRKGCGL